jgi:Clr5 domain
MRNTYSFNPSKRAYQTQFKRWAFPSKQNPVHRNLDLVARVKQLWEQNSSQRDMLSVLNDEGYNVKERELMRLRAKHRWLLRVPNGMKASEDTSTFQQEPLTTTSLNSPSMSDGSSHGHNHDLDLQMISHNSSTATVLTAPISAPPPAEVIQKRKERQNELQAWSDERWAAKKRRRRTRGWGGMGADPPGPPRFPSETTLGESQQFLSLDNDSYRRIRERFQIICDEGSIIKKTLAGPEKWSAAKDRLIREDPHLQAVFWADTTNLEAKALALDVVCLDVTKRMRTSDRCMTIAAAKNALGVNPEQGRQIRNTFYSILKANHFTSKTEAGKELWQEMKQQWIDATPFLQEALSPTDPQYATRSKALDVLCRDVMKRLRDDVTKQSNSGGGIRDESQSSKTPVSGPGVVQQPNNSTSTPAVIEPARPPSINSSALGENNLSNLQIDPTLLQSEDFLPSFPQLPTSPVAVYVRPHPKSEIHQSTKMWLGTLSTRTVLELNNLLASKWADAIIVRVDGVEKGPTGEEISYLIEEDEELDAYLDHVQNRKAIFVAMLKKR